MSVRMLLALAAGLAACGSRGPEVPAPQAAAAAGSAVTLERGPCFGG